MKTITFTWNPGLWAYDSDSDDPLGVGTKTGTYVLASEANECVKVLEDTLRLEREECAKIAEKYEPDEKLDYVTYASREIRLRCAALEVKP